MSKTIAANQRVAIRLSVNGQTRVVEVEPPRMLAQLLRDDLGLTGTKVACGMANCGACTVLRDGVPIYSCITLAIDCEDAEITTVEGLADRWRRQHPAASLELVGGPHPIQSAFVEEDAYQCGYCTSGQILSMAAFLDHNPSPSEFEIRSAMEGNLCRCGAYLKIVKAGMRAAAEMRGKVEGGERNADGSRQEGMS